MKPSAISEKEAIAALRYHLKLRRAKQRRMVKAYAKLEKIQIRGFSISSGLTNAQMTISGLKAWLKQLDKMSELDAKEYEHLAGKVVDKTAGRNRLRLGFGK